MSKGSAGNCQVGSEPVNLANQDESPSKKEKTPKKEAPINKDYKIKYASAVEKFLGDTFAPELLSN